MIRLLPIPVAGTIAALVAILLAHEPREVETRPPPEPPPFDLPEHEPEPETTPPPEPEPLYLTLEADGALVDVESGERFASAADLVKSLEDEKPRIFIRNGEGVGEQAVDALIEELRDRYVVRKDYRAPGTPSGD